MKKTMALIAAFMVVGLTADASALDGYEDRRGLFAGLKLGGGVGASSTEFNDETTGLDDGRQLGLDLSATVGGGAGSNLLFGGQGNWWIRTVQLGDRSLAHSHFNFLGIVDLFIIEGLYVEGGFGLAYAAFDTERPNDTTFSYRELGLAAKVGVGYEFFINGTNAFGLQAHYTRHFYNNADFDTIGGGLTLRWY